MLKEIKQVGSNLGITVIITQSKEKIETQLNRIMRIETLPVMLISWDIKINLEIDETTGRFKNPHTTPKVLLLGKSLDTTNESKELKADEMARLFQNFILALHEYMVANSDIFDKALTQVSYQLVPNYGAGKHSGVIGNFALKLPTPGYTPKTNNSPLAGSGLVCPLPETETEPPV